MITPKDTVAYYDDDRPKRFKKTITDIDSTIARQAKTDSTRYTYYDCDSDLREDIIKYYTKLGWFVKYKRYEFLNYLLFYGDNTISWWKKLWL